MEDICSFWTYEENVEELKQKLEIKTYELEATKKQANEEIKKSKDNVKQLLNLLLSVCHERDQAKSQLRHLLSLSPPPTPPPTAAITPHSPATSPDTSATDPGHTRIPNPDPNPSFTPILDEGSLIIESLAKRWPLPQKGQLLKAVLEAGPLLQTLMVAGPLPRWRNPPTEAKTIVPVLPVTLKGYNESAPVHQDGLLSNSSLSYGYSGCGSSQIYHPTQILNFGSGSSSGSGMDYGIVTGSGSNLEYPLPASKRRRIVL